MFIRTFLNYSSIKSFLFLWVMILVFPFKIIAQIDTIFFNNQPWEVVDITRIQGYFIEKKNENKFEDIVINAKYEPYNPSKRSIYLQNTIWVKFVIKNNMAADTLKLYANFGKQKCNFYYTQQGFGNINFKDLNTQPHGYDYKNRAFIFPINIPAKSFSTYWLRFDKFIYFNNIGVLLIPQNKTFDGNSEKNYYATWLFAFIWMVTGLFFFTGIIASLQWLINKDHTYAFWAMYLFINALFFAAEVNRSFGLGIFTISKYNIQNAPNPWPSAIQYVVSIMYLLFISSFLEIKIQNSKIYKFIWVSIKVMLAVLIFALFAVVCYDFGYTDYADMFLVVTNLLILLTVIFIIRSKIPQKNLLMIGSLGVLITSTVSIIVEIIEKPYEFGFWLIPIVCYSLGAVWELTFFSLALGQRSRLIQLENQQLQKNYTSNLENELGQRIDLIKTQDKLLEDQRINTLTTAFEQKIAESEISALRAQMNPHFIFNCLNSIEFFTANNQPHLASEYLTKFSRLIRLVLENSRSEKVSLQNEIDTLKLYLDMEAMRFKGKIKYKINIDENIEIESVAIPPLLIQPFVENAIWHGLMHKEKGGLVTINVQLWDNNKLHIEIIDNGIGREKAAEYKSKSATKNKSFGMKVTSERIELINQLYKTNTKIEIVDLKNEKNEATGTKVTVGIPI